MGLFYDVEEWIGYGSMEHPLLLSLYGLVVVKRDGRGEKGREDRLSEL